MLKPKFWTEFRAVDLLILLMGSVMLFLVLGSNVNAQSSQNPQSEAAGLTGVVGGEPPTQAAIISFPTNGAVFTEVPIDVTGICQDGLLVKLFKNEVFAGSDTCTNGTFTITTDLFSGQNELIARVYDNLDQAGPDSATVTVTYNDTSQFTTINERVFLTTNFARRGANPGETLVWPMSVTGGTPPYAVSVNWGGGEEDLVSITAAGEFDLRHIYETAGTYRVIVKATDVNGTSSFLQLAAVANGAVGENTARVDENGDPIVQEASAEIPTWSLYAFFGLLVSTFWIGTRYQKQKFKKKASRHKFFSRA